MDPTKVGAARAGEFTKHQRFKVANEFQLSGRREEREKVIPMTLDRGDDVHRSGCVTYFYWAFLHQLHQKAQFCLTKIYTTTEKGVSQLAFLNM